MVSKRDWLHILRAVTTPAPAPTSDDTPGDPPLAAKAPAASRTQTTHLVLPGQTNALGTIFGGIVMQWIDEIGAVVAMRHAGGQVVTAAVDALQFLQPIQLGDLVVMRANVNWTGHSSMEIGVRVEVEDPRSGVRKKTTKAYLTFVAIDHDGRPRPVAPLRHDDAEDARRFAEGAARRAARLAAREHHLR